MTESVDVAIGVSEGKVIARWPLPVTEIVFDAKNAYAVGMALARAAMDAHRGYAAGLNADQAAFLEAEAKRKVTDEKREYLIGVVATQIRSLIGKGASPGVIAMHAVDAVLQETVL